MPSAIPEETRAAVIADLESENGSTRDIAERHGISPASVSRIGSAAGIELDRSKTKIATEAVVADARARRAIEASESINVAAHLRGKLLKSESGRDAQGWATAYGIMIDKHAMLDRHDADLHGLAAVDAWLREMIGD
jgi:transposase-like protein